jgi:hypothetical protein
MFGFGRVAAHLPGPGLARHPAHRMIARMEHQQGVVADAVRRWVLRSERFLEAAECLPASPAFDSPQAELLALAVEYRLMAYLCAARGGAPYGAGLDRLNVLARHCGLSLSATEQQAVAVLERRRSSDGDLSAVPAPALIRDLCRTIAAQTPGAGGSA